jgi:thiosulfate dehydrogenase
MKASSIASLVSIAVLTAASGAALVGALDVHAKQPFTAEEAAQQRAMLLDTVRKGYELWHDSSLGTNGLACGNCHPDASASNPHTFPKYQTNLNKVGTLRDMINWCITVPLQGKPIALDSDQMIAMEAYATFMHRGVAIAPGKDEQHGGVPVKSGPGFPTGDDGNL